MKLKYIKRAINKVLKQNKWLFYYHEKLKWNTEIKFHKQNNGLNNLKSAQIIKREEKLVRDYWRIGTFHYYRYGLQYKHLSDEQLLDYVPTYYFHKNIEKHHQGIDTVKYGDKLTQALLFEERGIPTAKVIAVIKNKRCTNLFGTTTIDLAHLIAKELILPTSKLFFKPTGNCGGAGILVLKREKDQLLLNGHPISSVDVFISKLSRYTTYIVEANIIQCLSLAQINSTSVNTIRVVVQRENNRMVIKTCILRMGRNGKEVDNSSQGGISIAIDPITGLFAPSATAEHGGGDMIYHPDSKYIFSGNGIHDWAEVKQQIEEIANKLIDFNDIALDIAITNEGVILVEFNFRYGLEHQQCVLGGMRRHLNIPNI